MRTKKKKYEALSNIKNIYEVSSGISYIYIKNENENIYVKSDNITNIKNQEYIYQKITNGAKKVILELCCGAGDYTIGMAKISNENNLHDTIYIGVDIKGDRLYKGANIALSEGINNISWIRGDIRQLLQILGSNSVDEIWITFPDPQLGDKNEHNRVTNSKFLDIYTKLLKPKGLLCIKTDDSEFANYTIGSIQKNNQFEINLQIDDVLDFLDDTKNDIYITKSNLEYITNIKKLLQITTWYENRRIKIGKKIKFLSYQLQ